MLTRVSSADCPPDVVLLPSPNRARFLNGERRPVGKCNVIIGVDNGKTVFCDADVGAGSRFKQYHMCPTHANACAVLLDHVDGKGNGVLSRRCRKCPGFKPLKEFDGLSDVCKQHPDDKRTGDGRRPTVVDLASVPDADVIVGGALTLEDFCVDDVGMVDVAAQTHCLVEGCGTQISCQEGLCGKHKSLVRLKDLSVESCVAPVHCHTCSVLATVERVDPWYAPCECVQSTTFGECELGFNAIVGLRTLRLSGPI